MRFTSLIAVSSLLISVAVFQVSAVDEASLTVDMETPMMNLVRRAGEEDQQTGDSSADVAEVQNAAAVQPAEAGGAEESNSNEGSGMDGSKNGAKEASMDDNVEAASANGKSGKHKGSKKSHASKAGGAQKSSKKSGVSKASKPESRVREASAKSKDTMLAMEANDLGAPRRARKAMRGSDSSLRNAKARRAGMNGGRRGSRGQRASPASMSSKKKGGLPVVGGLLGGLV